MVDRVKVMLSSTIADLVDVREQVALGLESVGLAEVTGMKPGSTPATAASSYVATVRLAEQCDLYVLVLGGRYGFVTAFGKSATQLEYEAAYRDDPTKVLVLRVMGAEPEPRQADFIASVEDYHHGYFVHRLADAAEAQAAAAEAFRSWLCDRAAIGQKLTYVDHFVRLVAQRTPSPDVQVEYATTSDDIELACVMGGRRRILHIARASVLADFWGTVVAVDRSFSAWREDPHG